MALIPRKRMSSDLLDPEPREGSYNGVTSDGVFKGTGKAIDNILDDGSASETIVVAVPSSQSSNYTVGNYYEVQGKVAKLRTKTDGDNVTQLTFDTASGVLEAINNSTGKIAVFYVDYDMGQKVYPNPNEILAAIGAGKFVVIDEPNQGVWEHTFWLLQRASQGSYDHIYFECKDRILVAVGDNTVETPVWTWFEKDIGFAKTEAIAPEYDSTVTYPTVGTAVMHNGLRYVSNTAINTAEDWTPAHWTETSVEDVIGNVESLLAAL